MTQSGRIYPDIISNQTTQLGRNLHHVMVLRARNDCESELEAKQFNTIYDNLTKE